jgi:hypothetical protein
MGKAWAASAAAAAMLAAAGWSFAQDESKPTDEQSVAPQSQEDVFADPLEPGEPDPIAAAAPPEQESPPAKPASELDGLSIADPEEPFPEEVATSKDRKPQTVTLRALNKITARYTDIEVKIGQSKRYAALEILPRYCDKRPPEEFPETTAFLEIFDREISRARTTAEAQVKPATDGKKPVKDVALAEKVEPAAVVARGKKEGHFTVDKTAPVDPDRIFSGWMFASSPGLNGLEHPVYDVWVIDCKTAAASK